MALTVGLIKEAFFIAKSLKSGFVFTIHPEYDDRSIFFYISPDGWLEVSFQGNLLLKENIISDTSMWGVESLDNLSRAISCLNNGSDNWKDYVYIEDSSA